MQRAIAVVGNAHVSLQDVSVTLMSAEIAGLGKFFANILCFAAIVGNQRVLNADCCTWTQIRQS